MNEWLSLPSSYWQRGCDDAKAGRPPTLPVRSAPPDNIANTGYMNGYDYGKRKYLGSLIGQRIMARELGAAALAREQGGKSNG